MQVSLFYHAEHLHEPAAETHWRCFHISSMKIFSTWLCTRPFAAQSLAAANKHTTWETSIEELKAYLGFMIVMGVNRLPKVRDYWSRDEKLHNTFIASRISHDRFEEISRYLHFVDNTTLPARDEPGYHRLQKVLPVISEMKQRFHIVLIHKTASTRR